MKALLKKFSYIMLYLLLTHDFSYAMTPEEFDQEMQVAIHSPRLPDTGIWKKLPRFLAKSHIRTDILANLSEESRKAVDGRDLGRGLIGGALVGLGLFSISFPEESKLGVSYLIMATVHGGISGAALGFHRRSSFLSENSYFREASRLLVSITAALGTSPYILANDPLGPWLTWGGLIGITSYLSVGRERVPDYALLTELDREAILTSYIYIKVPKLVQALEDSEAPPPPVAPIPQPLRVNTALPTAWVVYESGLRNLYVTSALNASQLVYDLEKNPSLRSNIAKLLKRMNAKLQTPFWGGADTFNVVTGNYGRYKGGKKPIAIDGVHWKEQAALITWSRMGEQPLILVSFKGTNKHCPADRTSALYKQSANPIGPGKARSGYSDIADSCKEELSAKITDICRNLKVAPHQVQILLTGHSMGAAVASIAAINQLISMKKPANDNNNVIVMNFGQPRIWHKKSVNKFQTLLGNDNLVRFVTIDRNGKQDPAVGIRLEKKDFFNYRHFTRPKVPLPVDVEFKKSWEGLERIHPIAIYREAWNNLQSTNP